MVREYTRKCNTVENIHIYKVIGPYRETELSSSKKLSQLLYKESTSDLITEASNSGYVHKKFVGRKLSKSKFVFITLSVK